MSLALVDLLSYQQSKIFYLKTILSLFRPIIWVFLWAQLCFWHYIEDDPIVHWFLHFLTGEMASSSDLKDHFNLCTRAALSLDLRAWFRVFRRAIHFQMKAFFACAQHDPQPCSPRKLQLRNLCNRSCILWVDAYRTYCFDMPQFLTLCVSYEQTWTFRCFFSGKLDIYQFWHRTDKVLYCGTYHNPWLCLQSSWDRWCTQKS